jgi:hypothetical protein
MKVAARFLDRFRVLVQRFGGRAKAQHVLQAIMPR